MSAVSSDAWFDCACGQRHWGIHGAAGLIVSRGDEVLLQLRAPRSAHGGTWGWPGGARQAGESALAAALREGREEAGLNPDALRPRWWSIADHRGWAYTTVAAEVRTGAAALTGPTNWETADLQWVERGKVGEYNLHPGLAVAWPYLERLIGQRLTLVVDGANVVGSRPDGWWKDRFGAAIRLRDRLETLAAGGLANVESDHPNGWYPEVVMVVEGRARGIGQGQSVRVVDAPGEGDDEIVAVARAAAQAGRGPVAVATADRGLIARLRALPGDVAIMPPSRLVGK